MRQHRLSHLLRRRRRESLADVTVSSRLQNMLGVSPTSLARSLNVFHEPFLRKANLSIINLLFPHHAFILQQFYYNITHMTNSIQPPKTPYKIHPFLPPPLAPVSARWCPNRCNSFRVFHLNIAISSCY